MCALSCRFLCLSNPPPSPPPYPFSSFSTGKPLPATPHEPDPKPLSQGHQWELAPLCENYHCKNYPLVSARDMREITCSLVPHSSFPNPGKTGCISKLGLRPVVRQSQRRERLTRALSRMKGERLREVSFVSEICPRLKSLCRICTLSKRGDAGNSKIIVSKIPGFLCLLSMEMLDISGFIAF